MNAYLQSIIPLLVERFGLGAHEFRDQVSLIVPPDKISEVCSALRDEYQFEMLSGISAVDYWPQQEPRFHVVYQLHSLEKNVFLGLRVPLNGNAPSMPSIVSLYPNANWHERETWDMFGIRFEGHPDLRRILMPYDWEGHPLRKDYPLGYEEVAFTFNRAEVMQRKPHPKE